MRIRSLCKLIVMISGGLVAAVVVVLLTVDFGAYKSEITAALTEVTGRELSIEGDFKLRFGIREKIGRDSLAWTRRFERIFPWRWATVWISK